MSKVKGKGIFGEVDIAHNPSGNIITDAVIKYFTDSKQISETINEYMDITEFLFIRTVKGGGVYNGEPIGKVARFYYSNESEDALYYITSGDLVPKSNNSKPLLDLPDYFPHDVDVDRYITEAEELLASINKPAKSGRNKKAFELKALGLSLVPMNHKGVTVMKHGYDYSTCESIEAQTGHRANCIAIEHLDNSTLMMGNWSVYQFNDKRFPGAMATVSKKLGFEVRYGKPIPITKITGVMKPLPQYIIDLIFNNLGKAQKVKVLDGYDFLL